MTYRSGMPSESFFELTGPANAPAVIFSHALGGDLSIWDAQVSSLSASYRVIRYDLRGHGRSPEHAGPLTLDDLGGDVLHLLDRHQIERVHFCGLSLGGMIGQWLGLNAQERLRSLVLVDSAPRMGTPDQWRERFEQIERHGMAAISGTTMSRWFTQEFREREPQKVAHIKSIFEATSPTGYISCAKVVRDASLAGADLERYGVISVPTLVVTGTFDSAATPEDCRAMASHIPGCRYQELTAAHISPVEASSAFTRTLEAFLQEQHGETGSSSG